MLNCLLYDKIGLKFLPFIVIFNYIFTCLKELCLVHCLLIVALLYPRSVGFFPVSNTLHANRLLILRNSQHTDRYCGLHLRIIHNLNAPRSRNNADMQDAKMQYE